jgi:hypothetical protein
MLLRLGRTPRASHLTTGYPQNGRARVLEPYTVASVGYPPPPLFSGLHSPLANGIPSFDADIGGAYSNFTAQLPGSDYWDFFLVRSFSDEINTGIHHTCLQPLEDQVE